MDVKMEIKTIIKYILIFSCGWILSSLVNPTSQPIKQDEVFGITRVLIPNSCNIDRLLHSLNYEEVKFDFPMEQFDSSSYITIKDRRSPNILLSELDSILKTCIIHTKTEFNTASGLKGEIGKYFSMSEETKVYIVIEKNNATVMNY